MSTLVGIDLSSPPDGHWAYWRFAVSDAAKFLQGQLSADVEKLGTGATTLAGLHNPQGRVDRDARAAACTATDELLASAAAGARSALSRNGCAKYILRAKVRIEDVSESLRVIGSVATPAPTPDIASLPWADRRILLAPADHPDSSAQPGSARARWERADVAAGLPQVYTADQRGVRGADAESSTC